MHAKQNLCALFRIKNSLIFSCEGINGKKNAFFVKRLPIYPFFLDKIT